MLFFLLKVTGVKYTEDQLLRSKGEAYRAYQQRTSAFVPWPPRGGGHVTSREPRASEPPRQP
jgi:steroid 5-alpha reductase family enzyme